MTDKVSVDRLRGQLEYLFEDRPELRDASPDELAARLDHDDRFARARAAYPNDDDEEARARIAEFASRIDAADVAEALRRVRPADREPGDDLDDEG